MIELMKFDKNQVVFQIDLKEESPITQIQTDDFRTDMNVSNQIYISTLPSSSAH
jgi:hypothetical protein